MINQMIIIVVVLFCFTFILILTKQTIFLRMSFLSFLSSVIKLCTNHSVRFLFCLFLDL